MKKKISAIVITLMLLASLIFIGCEGTVSGVKGYTTHANLIPIEGYSELYYYAPTGIVYIVFNEFTGSTGYGYMGTYYSINGYKCRYNLTTKRIEEIINND